MSLFGVSPAWVLCVLLGIGAGAGYLYLETMHSIEVTGIKAAAADHEANALTDRSAKDAAASRQAIVDFAAKVNGAADTEVAAGDEAADLVPRIRDRQQLIALCKEATACRTGRDPGAVPLAEVVPPAAAAVDPKGGE